jgi:hypothetical protein
MAQLDFAMARIVAGTVYAARTSSYILRSMSPVIVNFVLVHKTLILQKAC